MSRRGLRRFLLLVIFALLSLGCIAVYSATAIPSAHTYGHSLRMMSHHLFAIGLGLALGLLCLALPEDWLRHSAKAAVLISLGTLAVVVCWGPEIGGAQRWFRIGRFSMQPSEFAQLALVLYLADFLARKGAVMQQWRQGFLPPMIVTGLMAGLVLVQPDLGTAIVMGAVALLMVVVAKARGRHVGLAVLLCLLALVILVAGEEYRRRRLLAFLNPRQDPLGAGFQILQSYVALAHGGIVGQGIGASVQKLFYLPSAHADFIFAIIGEELGVFGTTALLGLFALFVSVGIRLAHSTPDPFSKYLIFGCVALLSLEAIVHMAVVTGLLPTKGLPLPLISYGGSSMVMNLMACAWIFWASRHGEHPTLLTSPVGR